MYYFFQFHTYQALGSLSPYWCPFRSIQKVQILLHCHSSLLPDCQNGQLSRFPEEKHRVKAVAVIVRIGSSMLLCDCESFWCTQAVAIPYWTANKT